MEERGKLAREAGIKLAATDTKTRNQALLAIAKGLETHKAEILAANEADLKRSQAENLAAPL